MKLNCTIRRFLPVALAVLGLCSLLIFLPPIHRDLNRPADQLMKIALAHGSTHFAMADLDGDLRPDLAMIRVSRYGSPQTEYSLELKFSTGTRPPIGGLEIFPQDVNGDQITDLVITSVTDSQFVAILLNDGKGNFTRADRSSYPHVGKRVNSRLLSPPDSTNYQLAMGQGRSLYGDEARRTSWHRLEQNSVAMAEAAENALKESATQRKSGRAPPLV